MKPVTRNAKSCRNYYLGRWVLFGASWPKLSLWSTDSWKGGLFFSIFLMNGPHSNGANVMHNCLQFVNEWQAPEQQRHSGTSWLRKRSPELLRQNGSPESGSQSCGAGSEMALLRWIVLLKSWWKGARQFESLSLSLVPPPTYCGVIQIADIHVLKVCVCVCFFFLKMTWGYVTLNKIMSPLVHRAMGYSFIN